MRRLLALLLAAVTCLSLTACGPRDHSILASTAVGAGIGTVGAAVVDGHPLVGALVGAGAGALIGSTIETRTTRYYHAPAPHPRPHQAHRPGRGMPPRHGHR